MNIIEYLKELERNADEADADTRIQQWLTVQRAEFLYKLEKEWPTLLAVVEAAIIVVQEYENAFDLHDVGFMDLQDAVEALKKK